MIACMDEIIVLSYRGRLVGFRLFVTKPWYGGAKFLYLEFDKKYVTSEDKKKFIIENQALWRTLELRQVGDKLAADDELYASVQVKELQNEKLVDKYLGYTIVGIQRRTIERRWRSYMLLDLEDYEKEPQKEFGDELGYFVRNADGKWVSKSIGPIKRDECDNLELNYTIDIEAEMYECCRKEAG